MIYVDIIVDSLSELKPSEAESFKKETNKEVILTSFTVLADIIENVAQDEFVVKSITKPGVEVHGYQPTPSDLIKASKAFVFIENGFGFELWAEKFVSNLKIERVTISNRLNPIFINEDFYKGKPNPHAWISPKTVSYTHLTLPTIYSV